MSLESRFQNVDWPKSTSKLRVVQLYIGDNPHLYFERADIEETHKKILEQVLKQAGITYSREWFGGPALEGPGYKVCGMGGSVESSISRDNNLC